MKENADAALAYSTKSPNGLLLDSGNSLESLACF